MHVRAVPSVAGSVLHRPQRLSKSLSRPASTSAKHPFPFPSCRNPSPHEIFHLPTSASQDQIKARYYELVKVYHPDAAQGQHDGSPSVRNARFRAITHAYGALRGRNSLSSKGGAGAGAWNYHESHDAAIRAELRRRSRRSGSPLSSTTTTADTDDAQLRYTLTAFVLVGMIVAVNSVSSHLDRVERHSQSAAANLAQARADAQVHGIERRQKIHERVKAFRAEKETADGRA